MSEGASKEIKGKISEPYLITFSNLFTPLFNSLMGEGALGGHLILLPPYLYIIK
jgi:hypothetical protein